MYIGSNIEKRYKPTYKPNTKINQRATAFAIAQLEEP